MRRDRVWRLRCGHIYHAQCWGRVAHAHADRQLAGTMEGAATEAPCGICRGVGPIAAEFHYDLAGDQDAANRHGEILRGGSQAQGPSGRA
eukprot:735947-Pyramimonas_sp.AAC.1